MNINECSIRRATIDDMLLYFEWANDPDVRQNSFNQNPITLEEHKEWFQKKLLSSTSYLYILECNGKPAGQIRFDIDGTGDSATIDFSISKIYRGKSLGRIILQKGSQKLLQDFVHTVIIQGVVKKENIASQRSFLQAGYKAYDLECNTSTITYYLEIRHE